MSKKDEIDFVESLRFLNFERLGILLDEKGIWEDSDVPVNLSFKVPIVNKKVLLSLCLLNLNFYMSHVGFLVKNKKKTLTN